MASLLSLATATSIGDLDLSDQELGDEGVSQRVAEWSAAASLPSSSLQTLNLSGNQISDAGAGVLAAAFASGLFSALTHLNLQDNDILDAGARALADGIAAAADAAAAASSSSPPAKQLAVLRLGYNDVGGEGALALATRCCCCTSGDSGGLTELDLQYNIIGPAGAEAFATALAAGNCSLVTLGLLKTGIEADGAAALARALLVVANAATAAAGGGGGGESQQQQQQQQQQQRLRSLDLGSNDLGDEGVSAFVAALSGGRAAGQIDGAAAGPPLSLERLFLFDNEIGLQGGRALVAVLGGGGGGGGSDGAAMSALRLTCLDLEENELAELAEDNDVAAAEVMGAIGAALKRNRTAKVARAATALIEAAASTGVDGGGSGGGSSMALNFQGDGIGDEGCVALAEAIDAHTAAFLASSPSRVTPLTSLNLNENALTPSSAARLANAVEASPTLTEVSLKYNRALDGHEALARIATAVQRNCEAKGK